MIDESYLLKIAEVGSISKAARELHLSQSTLSQRLKLLERKLGCTLFDRSTTPLKPTYAGEVYLKWVKSSVSLSKRAVDEMRAISRREKRRMRIGASVVRAGKLLAVPASQFAAREPECALELVEASGSSQLEAALLDGRIDFAIGTPFYPAGMAFDVRPVGRERLVVAVRRDMARRLRIDADSKGITIEQLATLPLMLTPSDWPFSRILEEMAQGAGVALNVVGRSPSLQYNDAMVRAGVCAEVVLDSYEHLFQGGEVALLKLETGAPDAVLWHSRLRSSPVLPDEELFVRLYRKANQTDGEGDAAAV